MAMLLAVAAAQVVSSFVTPIAWIGTGGGPLVTASTGRRLPAHEPRRIWGYVFVCVCLSCPLLFVVVAIYLTFTIVFGVLVFVQYFFVVGIFDEQHQVHDLIE